jgi:hypothetical protein
MTEAGMAHKAGRPGNAILVARGAAAMAGEKLFGRCAMASCVSRSLVHFVDGHFDRGATERAELPPQRGTISASPHGADFQYRDTDAE